MSRSRRSFLKSLLGTPAFVSLGSVMPSFLNRTVMAMGEQPAAGETVLVVVQLSGGNDGLNTVVPVEDDAYARSRTTLRLTKGQVHPIDELLGFHPQMPQCLRLLQAGELMVVQGVGYPNSQRDHDAAMRDWHTARPEQPECQTGWLGRAIDRADREDGTAVPGALVAPIPLPLALGARRAIVPSVRTAQQWTLVNEGGVQKQRSERVEGADHNDENPLLDLARRATLASHITSDRVREVLRGADQQMEYPGFGLASQLKTIAELIRAELGVRIFFAEIGGGGIGGFDNHANQRDNHAALLRELSVSIASFVDDLRQAKLLDRVLLMTYSEFGRTLSENGRRGTGHGAAAPVFLAGGRLRGGLFGESPNLADLDVDAPRHQIDYRQLYATALESWLGFPSEPVLGGEYPTLDLLA